MVAHENAWALASRVLVLATPSPRASSISLETATTSSVSSKYSSSPAIHLNWGISWATVGRPQAIASRNERGDDSYFGKCKNILALLYSDGIKSGDTDTLVNLPGNNTLAILAILSRNGPSPATIRCAFCTLLTASTPASTRFDSTSALTI